VTAYRVRATLSLTPTSEGGLAQPLPAGTRSLLLRFPADDDGRPGEVTLGAVLTPRNAAELTPGSDTDADVLFWADEARIHATAGAPFELWYGRPVGHGTVTALTDELGAQP
jgi:hypothetical protein